MQFIESDLIKVSGLRLGSDVWETDTQTGQAPLSVQLWLNKWPHLLQGTNTDSNKNHLQNIINDKNRNSHKQSLTSSLSKHACCAGIVSHSQRVSIIIRVHGEKADSKGTILGIRSAVFKVFQVDPQLIVSLDGQGMDLLQPCNRRERDRDEKSMTKVLPLLSAHHFTSFQRRSDAVHFLQVRFFHLESPAACVGLLSKHDYFIFQKYAAGVGKIS